MSSVRQCSGTAHWLLIQSDAIAEQLNTLQQCNCTGRSLLVHSGAVELLRSHVHWGAIIVAGGEAGLGGVLHPADSKVCNLGPAMLVQQNVAWLQIPVDHKGMQVSQALCQVPPQLQ